jgi:hypothetical protein
MTQFPAAIDLGALIVREGAISSFCRPSIDPAGRRGISIVSADDFCNRKAY